MIYRLPAMQIQNCLARTVVKASKSFISHLSSDLCTGSRLMNALNINSSHSPTKFLQPANLTTYTILSLILSLTGRTCPSSLVTLARPSVSSSLPITNRSFIYAPPYLWNEQPSSFRQPHSVHSPPGSPHPAHITSSQSPPSLSSPIPASTFHSRLETHPFLAQILSSIVTLIPSGLPSWILTCTVLKGHWRLF